MKLSVIIVSYNVKYYLEQCICSLQRACRKTDAEIWVVDNDSRDGSAEFVASRFPEVKIIANKNNEGFSRANNMALKKAQGEYVLLINPDTFVGEDTLARCIRFMDSHPSAGAVGAAMLKDDGSFAYESRRGLPTPFTAFCKMTGLCALFPHSRIFGRYYMRFLNKNKVNRIDVVSGAFCMARRSALDQKVGLLDEDYFMYGEDIDLSYRLLQAGYKNYYLPLRILHYKGESTQKSSFRYVHVFYKAMLIFFNKHYRNHCQWLAPIVHAAVVVRGFFDFCAQKNKQMQYKIGLKKEEADKKSYLFLGESQAADAMRELAAAKGLNVDFVSASQKTLPHGHLGLRRKLDYDYVVYDTESYSYKRILLIMSHEQGKHGLRLGTFSRQTGRLVTMKKVFCL